MARTKGMKQMTRLFSHTLLTTPLLLAMASVPALAQTATGLFDPAQMPTTKGTVSQYELTPRGDVDGLILTDGTEVHIPPYLGQQLVQGVKPGDSVTIHGLRARAIPLVQAMSVTNDKSGTVIADTNGFGGPRPGAGRPGAARPMGPPPPPPGSDDGQSTQIQDTVKMTLHGPRGEVNGVLLTNGTIVRMPPPAAAQMASLLVPGKAITVSGNEMSSDLGHVLAARAIGPAGGTLEPIGMAPPPPPGAGPDAGAPPPPPPAPDANGAPAAPPQAP